MKKEIVITAIALVTASCASAALKQGDAGKMDKNKDGKVSQAEFVAARTASFKFKDKNKDGVLTTDEFTHAYAFRSSDANKDGKLTAEEYASVYVKQFKNSHDKNKDGFIAGDEIQ